MRTIWMRFLLPVIVGMSAALTASMILHPEQISRRSAVHFFRDYYKLAVEESGRDRTWEMLSPDFQKEAVRGGRRAYNGFFSGMKEVRVNSVRRLSGELNWFVVNLTYTRKQGKPSQAEPVFFGLVCKRSVSVSPLANCGAEDLFIDDGVYPDASERTASLSMEAG